jgi:hypothetical protein
MASFKFRSLLQNEHGSKCSVMKPNHMQCGRRVTRALVIDPEHIVFLCEGDFQVMFQTAVAEKATIEDMDAVVATKLSVLEPVTGDRSLSQIELNKAAAGGPLPTKPEAK